MNEQTKEINKFNKMYKQYTNVLALIQFNNF